MKKQPLFVRDEVVVITRTLPLAAPGENDKMNGAVINCV